ncbi:MULTISPECIES: hypothetical protein [unclassified Lactobacillus]|uniref:hypothetical protein n=1 Tax=unclassified Lactobacillus TaxID=2620435 RepID=UPI0023F68E97|nr:MULTISPECIES: hypothetical protein [unclassified Lactobacillus]MDF7668570.1 hypothetical protein [Lactobacillus sp. ESL0703]WEV39200.1 hypothetical protein OZX58_02885 [Lactobacillus sp. ESL0680]
MEEIKMNEQLISVNMDNSALTNAQLKIDKLGLSLAEYLNLVLTNVPNSRTQLKHILAEIGSQPADKSLAMWLNRVDAD